MTPARLAVRRHENRRRLLRYHGKLYSFLLRLRRRDKRATITDARLVLREFLKKEPRHERD